MMAPKPQLKNEPLRKVQPQIGEVVRAIRTELGGASMTQEEFAAKVGVSRSMITHCEISNTVPSDQVLVNMAAAFSRDPVEYTMILRRLRRAALYSRAPDVFNDVMMPSPGDRDVVEMSRNLVFLTPNLTRLLQTAMQRRKATMASLVEGTGIEADVLRDAFAGLKALSRDELKRLCTALRFSFAQAELMLGRLPKSLATAVDGNIWLLEMLAELDEKCRKLNGPDLMTLCERLMSQVRED